MGVKRGCSILRLFLYIPVIWIFAIFFLFGYMGMQGQSGDNDFSVSNLKKRLAKKAIEILDENEEGRLKALKAGPLQPPGKNGQFCLIW